MVSFTVKPVITYGDLTHLLVGDGHTSGIIALVDLGPRRETCFSSGDANWAHDRSRLTSGFATPVHGDVRKQATLDSIPLAGSGASDRP